MSERFAWIYDKTRQAKIWCADMWSRKAVLAIRTAITGITSRLTTIENAGYQTASDVSAAIASAIGGITELEYLVVSTLPASGTKGVVYLVPHQHGTRDIYDEYIWVNNAFEKIGSTDVDLSQYLLKTDISAWAKASTKPTYTASEVGALPDTTSIPSKTSDLTNDSGFITGYTETDPTVPSWAKASTKPTYTAAEVGALPDDTVIPTVPTKVSAFQNDAGYLTSYTETDPTVPSWAKQSTKPSYTAAEVGALPNTTHIPTKTSDLTNDSGFITGYTETDPTVPAWSKAANKPTYTAAEVGALPDTTLIPTKTSDLLNDSGFLTSIPGTIIYYGECTTAAAEQTKVVVCPGFSLVEGAVIVVRFTSAQNYSPSTNVNVLMNVNGTGAKQVKRAGTTYLPRYFWAPGQIVPFAYDGTNWVMVSGGIATTTYFGITRLTESLTSTATTLALSASAGKSLQDQIDALSDRITALGG